MGGPFLGPFLDPLPDAAAEPAGVSAFGAFEFTEVIVENVHGHFRMAEEATQSSGI